mmetsp:Transcript_31/g.58  ORF Transcript_31/g.58 Transcript_31/m.58 type:complete len:474 (+) Transcript_31:274-1695(+)
MVKKGESYNEHNAATSVYSIRSTMQVLVLGSFLLLSSMGATLAFQSSINHRCTLLIPLERKSASRSKRPNISKLNANDGGQDAFTAQLQAALAEAATSNAETSNTLVDEYANNMMDESRTAFTATAAAETSPQSSPATQIAPITKTGKHAISSLLMQRAIQTQLYYLSDLRDEPTYVWLREFLNHHHLDDKGRFNELDGLRCSGGWQYYLEQLEEAPHFTITVELAPPRLSAQQKRNPYLAAQVEVKSYEETIMPSKISQTLRTVARSLEKEWVPVLAELAAEDRKRVRLFDAPPQLQTAAAAYQAYWQERAVVAGGEGDDQDTPLHALNCRIVTRFCTRVALHEIIAELEGGNDASVDGSNEDAEAKGAAIEWLREFAREWEPRLNRGADDDVRRNLGVAPPGHWQRLCDGADADDVTEAMWQELPPLFAYTSEDAMRLYSPEALSARLRKVRADVCDELINDLQATILSMS